jgi:hypothetical protein
MLVVVLGLFVVCRCPWHVAYIVHDSVQLKSSNQSYAMDLLRYIGALFAVCNNWMTPVVYALFNVRIRDYIFDKFVRGILPRFCVISLTQGLPNNAAAVRPALPAVASTMHASTQSVEPGVHVIGGGGSPIAFIGRNYDH